VIVGTFDVVIENDPDLELVSLCTRNKSISAYMIIIPLPILQAAGECVEPKEPIGALYLYLSILAYYCADRWDHSATYVL
jgi:hypothetical protein